MKFVWPNISMYMIFFFFFFFFEKKRKEKHFLKLLDSLPALFSIQNKSYLPLLTNEENCTHIYLLLDLSIQHQRFNKGTYEMN